MKMMVIKTESVVTTELYEIEVGEEARYFIASQKAITATTDNKPIGTHMQRDVHFECIGRN